jgi:hypothetical protein
MGRNSDQTESVAVLPFRMTERNKQNDFVRELIRSHDCADSRDLESRIARAERDERCIWRALLLALLLALFSVAGLCYSAVFLPEFFRHQTPAAVWFFSAVLFASGICLLSFGLFWCWYRSISNALYHEARKFVLKRLAGVQADAPGAVTARVKSASSKFLDDAILHSLPTSPL